MRAVIQRVKNAEVNVDGKNVSETGAGLLVYIGVSKNDTQKDARWTAEKIANMRIFEDDVGKMNLSCIDTGSEIMLVPNFTLYGDCRKGRRPGFDMAGGPDKANQLFEKVAEILKNLDIRVKNGVFAAHMHVSSVNDGPINFLVDSRKTF